MREISYLVAARLSPARPTGLPPCRARSCPSCASSPLPPPPPLAPLSENGPSGARSDRDPPPRRARECSGFPAHDPNTERGHSPRRQDHGNHRPGSGHRRQGSSPPSAPPSTTARFPSAMSVSCCCFQPGQHWPDVSIRPSSTSAPPCHPVRAANASGGPAQRVDTGTAAAFPALTRVASYLPRRAQETRVDHPDATVSMICRRDRTMANAKRESRDRFFQPLDNRARVAVPRVSLPHRIAQRRAAARIQAASRTYSSSSRPVSLDRSSLEGSATHSRALARSSTSGSSTPRACPPRSSAAYMSLKTSGKSKA